MAFNAFELAYKILKKNKIVIVGNFHAFLLRNSVSSTFLQLQCRRKELALKMSTSGTLIPNIAVHGTLITVGVSVINKSLQLMRLVKMRFRFKKSFTNTTITQL